MKVLSDVKRTVRWRKGATLPSTKKKKKKELKTITSQDIGENGAMLLAYNERKIYEANFQNQWLYLCYLSVSGSICPLGSEENLLTLGCDEGT